MSNLALIAMWVGAIFCPRVTLGIVAANFIPGGAVIFSFYCFFWAWINKDRLLNRVHAVIRGKPIIIKQTVEKVVEKPTIQEHIRTVTQTIWKTKLSREEAYSCLGCKAGASREEIVAGYSKMIKKVHPDTGGSMFLASCVNQARDMLLPQK